MEPYLMRSFLLIFLFAFVGTQARTLLDHCNGFKAETSVGRHSNPPPPAPFSSPPHKEVSKILPNNMLEKPNTNPVSMIPSKNKQTLDSPPALQNYRKRPRSPPPPAPFSSPPTKEVSNFLPNNMLAKPHTNQVSMITSKNKQTLDSAPALQIYGKRRSPPPPSPGIPPTPHQLSSNVAPALQNYGKRPRSSPPPSPGLPPPPHHLSSNVLVMFKKSLSKIFLSTA